MIKLDAHQPDEFGFSVRTDVGAPLYARCDVVEFRQIERVFDKLDSSGSLQRRKQQSSSADSSPVEAIGLKGGLVMTGQTTAIEIEPVGFTTMPALKLPTEDGEPLETNWHRAEINLLIETLGVHWRRREDYYAGGNMFVYYSLEQARSRKYRGPDFFVVLGVDGSYDRRAWVVWEEGGRYPDVIIELLSPSTANQDLTTKKTLYEQTFRTGEYFCYDPDTQVLRGWRLVGRKYEEVKRSEGAWLWSESLGLWLGLWDGRFLKFDDTWLRFYDEARHLVPTEGEFERQRAEQAEARAKQAEAELVQLRAELETSRRQSENK